MEPILGDKFHDEKISPVLTVYKAKDFKDAYRILVELTNLVGRGHSCGIHTYKHEYIEFLGEHMKSSRITVRQSMSAGNGGHPFNRMPSTATLGCGTWGRQQHHGKRPLAPLHQRHVGQRARSPVDLHRRRNVGQISGRSTANKKMNGI